MNFKDLTSAVRVAMRQEVESDIAADRLYVSRRFSERGVADYPNLLLEAVDRGTPGSLAAELNQKDRLLRREMSTSKTGTPYEKDVPINAAETAAEGEFNRFYCRAVCVVAIADNREVEVDRVKEVANARSASIELLDRKQRFDPTELLVDLRASVGVDTAMGLPPGPNSGLSIRLV